MIIIEDHIKEIDGVKYVPYDIVVKQMNESYISSVDKISTQLQDAMSEYKQELDKLGLND
tara:strand:+ start:27 stop:206 length:180 start_codon:yes stop_codon:yes gene_type:complete